jgi:FSR family fosmidomycin resistance protein-like MFS transporter
MFPVLIPMIRSELGLSDVQVGGLVTVKQAASGLLTLPSGFIADAFSRFRPLILGAALLSGGIAYLIASVAPTYIVVLLFLVFLGLSSALWHPTAVSSLSLYFPNKRGTVLALHGVGASIGDSVGPLCIGALLVLFTWQDIARWHIIPAVIFGLLLWKVAQKSIPRDVRKKSGSSYREGIRDLAKTPTVFLVMLASSFAGMARLSIITFLPLYLSEEIGYSTFWLGFHWALLYAMGMVSQPIMGVISDKFSRKTVLLPAFLSMAILYLLLPMATHPILIALVIGLMGIFFYGTSNIAQAAVLDVAAEQVQGTTHSVMSLFQQILTLPSPIFAGLIVAAFGMTQVFYYASFLVGLSSVIWVFIRFPKHNPSVAEQ